MRFRSAVLFLPQPLTRSPTKRSHAPVLSRPFSLRLRPAGLAIALLLAAGAALAQTPAKPSPAPPARSGPDGAAAGSGKPARLGDAARDAA